MSNILNLKFVMKTDLEHSWRKKGSYRDKNFGKKDINVIRIKENLGALVQANSEAHQMEPPSLLISWVNTFPCRLINRTIFFCNALESHECACCLLSFLYFHWLFPLSARETSPRNRSIYKSTRERVDSKGLYGRCRPHLMGSWPLVIIIVMEKNGGFL